jgi:2-polyprenyl-6-methoxyphenol hydroxylase-like FAD-dependent oxidoreductase
MSQQPLHSESSISVIGGSLVGPLLSLLLTESGFTNVKVYEATPAAVPQAGGVIGLDLVSLDVLDSVGIDQHEIIPFESERVVSIKIKDRREVGRVQTIYPGRNTTWTLLHQALIARLPKDSLHTGKRLADMTEGDDGRALLRFADGEQVESEFVAFADGRKSTGRKLLDPARQLRYAGYVAARGQLECDPMEVRDFTRFEPDGLGQFNIFPIALANGRVGLDWTLYVNLGPDQFREWFGASPITRTFVLPNQVSEQARWAVDHHAEQILTPAAAELVHNTTTRMAAPIVDIDAPGRMVYPVADSRAVLIGDALAPVRPHTAKGLNLGIQEAAGLAQVLRQHRRHGADLDAALSDWQDRHLPQVADTLSLGTQIAQRFSLGGAHS